MITKEKFSGNTRGRDKNYPYEELKPGTCLNIDIPKGLIPEKFRHNIAQSLYQWKKYNSISWQTAVRIDKTKNQLKIFRIS